LLGGEAFEGEKASEKIKGYNSHFGAVGLRVRGGRRLTTD